MRLTVYQSAGAFVRANLAYLEREEVVNGLIIGLVLGLQDEPLRWGSPAYLANPTSNDIYQQTGYRPVVISGRQGSRGFETGPSSRSQIPSLEVIWKALLDCCQVCGRPAGARWRLWPG